MSSKKPQLLIRADEITLKKIKYIAEEDGRSMNNLIVRILEKEIMKYELENGKIEL